MGQRVQKTSAGNTTDYVYDLNGLLIGEYDDGTLIREYIYFHGLPIAQIDPSHTIYLHPDHLGSPRTGTDNTGTVVWTWAGEAFGSALPDEDPDNDLTDTVVNLRFPGQYFDDETGMHYNYFRDYDPAIGRYIESDPIGLIGGLNQFSYVHSSPTNLRDPFGLKVPDDLVVGCQGVGCRANNIPSRVFREHGFQGCVLGNCYSRAIGDSIAQHDFSLELVGGGYFACWQEPNYEEPACDADGDGLDDLLDEDGFVDEFVIGTRTFG